MDIQGNNKMYWNRIDNWKFILFDLDYCDAGIDRNGSQIQSVTLIYRW